MKLITMIIFFLLSSPMFAYNRQEIIQVLHQSKQSHSQPYFSIKPGNQLRWQNMSFPTIHGKSNVVVIEHNPLSLIVYNPYSSNTTIYKSNDRGEHWKKIASPHVYNIHQLISIDKNHLLLAGDNKIYLSQDQGQHWTLSATIDQSCDKLFLIAPTLIFLTTNSNYPIPGLYRSMDGGKTFAPARLGINEGFPFSTLGGKENSIVAGTDRLFISTNKGLLWSQPSISWNDKLLSSVAINRQNDIFLAANNRLYKTNITGQVWEISNKNLGYLDIIKIDIHDRLYAVGHDNGYILHRSLDNGLTWEFLHRFNQLLDIHLLNNDTILVNTDDGLMISDESQLNYTPLASPSYSNSTSEHVLALNNEDFFATALAYAGPLYGSHDAGKTWVIKRNEAIIDVKAFNQQIVTLEYSGNNQQIMLSVDRGNTWQSIFQINHNYCHSLSSQHGGLIINCIKENYFTSDLIHWFTLKVDKKNPILTSYFSGTTIYMTDGDSIKSSSDNGLIWQNLLTHLNQHHAYISGYNDEVLIIAINDAGIIKMTRSGKYWDLINTGVTNFNFTNLIVIDENHYIVSTDNGIFYTQNGGKYWLAENNGLNNRTILSLSLYQTTLLAGTDGSGVYKAHTLM